MQAVNKERQEKLAIMRGMKITGKRFRALLKVKRRSIKNTIKKEESSEVTN